MSGLGSYGSGSYYSSSLMAPSMNQNRRSDRGDYDDRRYAERSEPRSRFSDNYREQSDLVGPRRQSRFSPVSFQFLFVRKFIVKHRLLYPNMTLRK